MVSWILYCHACRWLVSKLLLLWYKFAEKRVMQMEQSLELHICCQHAGSSKWWGSLTIPEIYETTHAILVLHTHDNPFDRLETFGLCEATAFFDPASGDLFLQTSFTLPFSPLRNSIEQTWTTRFYSTAMLLGVNVEKFLYSPSIFYFSCQSGDKEHPVIYLGYGRETEEKWLVICCQSNWNKIISCSYMKPIKGRNWQKNQQQERQNRN